MSIFLSIVPASFPLEKLSSEQLNYSRDTSAPADPNQKIRPLAENITTIEFTESSHSVYPWDEWWDGGLIEGLKAHDIKPVVSDNRIEPIYGPLGWLNVLVPAMPGIAGALGAVLGAWLTQHGGRKLKLKVGDKEFEARTPAELEVLLKLSQGIQAADGTKSEKATIGAIAHELWIARGRPEGSPEVDWLQAENLFRLTKKS